MIKASELRIGNWVNVGSGYTQVESIHFPKGIDLEVVDGNFVSLDARYLFDEIEPIPVTPGVLEGIGFEKRNGILSYQFWEKDGIQIKLFDDHFIRINLTQFMTEEYQVKYTGVHQLQNLYLTLTGEELELKSLKPEPVEA